MNDYFTIVLFRNSNLRMIGKFLQPDWILPKHSILINQFLPELGILQ